MSPQARLHACRKDIFRLVLRNEVPQALSRLGARCPSTDGTDYAGLLLRFGQYKDPIDRQLAGLIDDEDANLEKHQLTHAQLQITKAVS